MGGVPIKYKGGGTNRHRYQMRCRRCDNDPKSGSGRFTLRRKPSDYKRKIKCPHCGETERLYHAKKDHVKEMEMKKQCFCFGLTWGHKKGEMLGCIHHPKKELTREDEEQIQGMLETERSG